MRRAARSWRGWAGLWLWAGCQQPPTQIEAGGSSGDGPPASSSGEATEVVDGTTTAMGTSAAGSSGSTTVEGSGSSEEGSGSSSTGEPADEPLGPFDAPVAVDVLNDPLAADDDPTLTGDMLEIYFASTRLGSEDVFVSTRASVEDAWDVPVPVDALNSFAQETFPEVSADGLVILLASNRGGGMGGLDLYIARRGDRADPWPSPAPLAALNTASDDYGVTPTEDLDQLFLCRIEAGGLGQSDVWQASLDVQTFVVGPLMLQTELSSPLADCSSSTSPSVREIFVETTRPLDGMDFLQDFDVWTATREDAADPWGAPVRVDEVSTSDFDDADPWLSPDRRTLYMASNRGDYIWDIYVTTRR